MIGAIIGDVCGSTREFSPVTSMDFELMPARSDVTDDSLMTIATGMAIHQWNDEGGDEDDLARLLIERMQELGRRFPHPMGSYGGRFAEWLTSSNPQPYNSWGNGSAMRVSAAGDLATSLDEALSLAEASAAVTHNHPEGIKGAQATAAAIHLARTGVSIDKIREFIDERFYPMNRTLAEIRDAGYGFNESCAGTVPEALTAVFESTSFGDAIRKTIWLGGDADTMGAITGSVAWAYYARGGITSEMKAVAVRALALLPEDLRVFVADFEARL